MMPRLLVTWYAQLVPECRLKLEAEMHSQEREDEVPSTATSVVIVGPEDVTDGEGMANMAGSGGGDAEGKECCR